MENRAPAYADKAARFAPHYVASNKCADAVFSATVDLLGNSNELVLNIDCGVAFLSFYLNEHGFTFHTDSSEMTKKGKWHGESTSILDCRAVSAIKVGCMIAENEIRDANTLSTWARLSARDLLPVKLEPLCDPR